MEELYSHKSYPTEVAAKIEAMGAMAISVANRWMLGWPDRAKALVKSETYMGFLESQVEQEKDVLANEANLRHLSRREVLQMYEIREAPPVMEL